MADQRATNFGVNMKIGIIGAGPIGVTLAKKFRGYGYPVKIANSRGADTLKSVAKETGAIATAVRDVVRDVDVVVISIPMKSVADLPKDLFDELAENVVIIDTNNYYPMRDGRIAELDNGKIESRYVSEHIGRPVIKAFNNMLSQFLSTEGKVGGADGRLALPVAGDDATAKRTVLELVDVAGFDGIDAGGIDDSWRQQPGTPVYCTDYDADGVRKALARADRSYAPTARDIVWDEFVKIPPGTDPFVFAGLVRTISRSKNQRAI